MAEVENKKQKNGEEPKIICEHPNKEKGLCAQKAAFAFANY